MSPTLDQVYDKAYQPFATNQIAFDEALKRGEEPMRAFMLKQTRQADVMLFARLAKLPAEIKGEEVPLRVLLPAFVTSELKTAFQIGFLIFIPFLVIDMIVASVLMSLGMMMLSPVLVALPFKLMLFVLADGWNLLIGSLAASFATPPDRCRGSHRSAARRFTMNSQQVFTLGQEGLLNLLMVSAPVLLTVLVVGLVVSIFQAATQISEATLSFVPKVVAAVLVLAFAGPWMMSTLVEYLQRTLQSIPSVIG